MNMGTNTPQVLGAEEKDPQGGGKVETILTTILETRQAIALLQSQLTELKKRAKVKIGKLNQVENTLLDSYENADRGQMTLFEMPAVPEDIQAILDDPRI